MAEVIGSLVSTVIPVFERPKLLQEAVQSVLGQTYRPIEIVLVDDGSTDATGEVADDLARTHPEVRVVHQEHGGPGVARETGRRLCRGEFLQYLDSDDVLLPRKFELQVAGLRAHPECGISYGKTRFCRLGEQGIGEAWKGTGQERREMFPSFLQSRWWGTSTPLYRTQVTDLAGPWAAITAEEDWEYDCRIASLGVLLHHVPEFVSEERDHDGHRLSRRGSSDPTKLRDRAHAHRLIWQHAQRAGVVQSAPEAQHFARELFLLARQCGAAGLTEESRALFDLARLASGRDRGRGWDFRLYRAAACLLGWRVAGKLSSLADRVRPRINSVRGTGD